MSPFTVPIYHPNPETHASCGRPCQSATRKNPVSLEAQPCSPLRARGRHHERAIWTQIAGCYGQSQRQWYLPPDAICQVEAAACSLRQTAQRASGRYQLGQPAWTLS